MNPSPWQYFTSDELTCKCGCGRMEMDSLFMDKLCLLRIMLGFALPVTSGFRCPAHNMDLGGTLSGPHTTGKAVDIQVVLERAAILAKFALNQGFHVGLRQHGDFSKRIIHLDLCDRKYQTIWTYPK